MTIKEIAESWGMSVNQFIEISGYSKQGLYDVLGRRNGKNNDRFNSFLEYLEFISEEIYQNEIEKTKKKASKEKVKRKKILEQLKEQKGTENV